MKTSALLLVATLIGLVYCQAPVPPRPLGYVALESPKPDVVLEAFYDFLCDDSAANWPILKQVMEKYRDKGLKVIMHIFPLVNHHNAFFMQKASEVVKNESMDMFIEFTDEAFKRQDEFLTGAVDMTEPQVQAKIAQFTEETTKVLKEHVMRGFVSKSVDNKARTAWKYACHRGITGCPQFIINGVHDPRAPDLDFQGWSKMIDDLMAMK